jgi:glucokinase
LSIPEQRPSPAPGVCAEPRADGTVLVGDVGGTNARFAVLETNGTGLALVDEVTYPSLAFESLPDALSALAADSEAARHAGRACFAIAGPIRSNRCEATNLPWVIDGGDLARVLGLPEVPLLNDLEAAAWGLAQVEAKNVWTLQRGEADPRGNRGLLSAGTGLGEAALLWHGDSHLPHATEGGHADFAPGDELQVELWRHLAERLGHVSWERVLSGPGLVALFRFLLARVGKPEPDWLEPETREGDAAAAITKNARAEGCPHCRAAIDLFVDLLAAEAGNLALRTLATGGVYLAGGTVRNLRDEIVRSRFREVFTAKGRFRPFLEAVPVHVVMDDRVGLRGAAAWAVRGD